MTVTINGQTGVTTPGLESAAMPNVGSAPVVESGSNSDGAWTRWADGTQHCSSVSFSIDATEAVGNIFRSVSGATWDYPSPFIQPPDTWGNSESSFRWCSVSAFSNSASVLCLSAINSTGAPVTAYATGRWEVPV